MATADDSLERRFAAAMDALAASVVDRRAPDCPVPDTAHRYVVAVSGGGDSLALLHLMRIWCRDPGQVLVVTVDHGLRAAAAEEARQVASWCAGLGVRHRICRAAQALPPRGIQAAARDLRYRLLAQAALDLGADSIVLAHTLDDQVETVVMRHRHDSGPVGLAGMTASTRRGDLPGAPRVIRPLLDFTGVELRAWLRGQGRDWIDDPSNRDQRFERVRVRNDLRVVHAGKGGDAAVVMRQIAAAATALGRAAQDVDAAATRLLGTALTLGRHGDDILDLAPLRAAVPPLACHALRGLLHVRGGGAFPPRRAAVQRLWTGLRAGIAGATLAGCRLRRHGSIGDRYLLLRDPRRRPPAAMPLSAGMVRIWAGTYAVTCESSLESGMELRQLGEQGLRRVAATLSDGACLAAVPAPARQAVPAIFRGADLLALPTLGCGPMAAQVRLARLPHPRRCGSACSDAPGILSTEGTDAPVPVLPGIRRKSGIAAGPTTGPLDD